MKIDDQRRSDNFEDRGRGGGAGGGGRRGGGGGVGVKALMGVVRLLGPKGTMVAVGVVGLLVVVNPFGLRSTVLSLLVGGDVGTAPAGTSGGSVCETASAACDFSARVLGATEDVWRSQFGQGRLPTYGAAVSAYQDPTLVVFSGSVTTACGTQSSAVGPFYCPGDLKLYIDPSFYDVMASKLKAPGDFAQAYVIAHEVGHHVQNLIGSNRVAIKGETENQTSVRVELQADCLAGVWGNLKRQDLSVDEADIREALDAAHAIGDDALGHGNERDYTHGSSQQRMAWFRKGFDSGDARLCDTFAEADYGRL